MLHFHREMTITEQQTHNLKTIDSARNKKNKKGQSINSSLKTQNRKLKTDKTHPTKNRL